MNKINDETRFPSTVLWTDEACLQEMAILIHTIITVTDYIINGRFLIIGIWAKIVENYVVGLYLLPARLDGQGV